MRNCCSSFLGANAQTAELYQSIRCFATVHLVWLVRIVEKLALQIHGDKVSSNDFEK